MTSYQPFPVPPQASFVPVRRSNTADVIVTSILLLLYAGGYLLLAFFSLFWAMATDSCGVKDCNTDYLTYAYVLTDVVGGAVLLAAVITAIVLMVQRRIAFWVPIVGVIIQVVLLVISIDLLGKVTG